ncbi:MAG: extracellular solute-binding protein [Lachnospiraceae bacterium]
MVSSGEKLDLAISIFEGGVANYANKGMLLELGDLVDQYGQDIVEAEGVAMKGGYFDGAFYGIPTEEKMGRVKAFECRKDLLDKYGIEYDENKIYTLEDLSEILLLFRPEREMPSTVSQQTEVRIRFIPTSITPISWEPAMHPAF